jgi:DNA-binding GntR family transcriptional regulator
MDLLNLAPVEQRTLSDEAAHRLRSAIRDGVLSPGIRLVERDLAERLGMSRIPVREAIQRLVEEGLVQKAPHRGTFVYAPTQQEIEEISSLRVVLECFVAERVVAHWTPELESELRGVVQLMRTAANRGDWQQIHEWDYQFHSILWEVANHALLLEVVSGLRTRINRFLFEAAGLLPTTNLEAHINTHDDLIDVLKAGNVANAQREMTRHVLAATTRIITYCNFSHTTERTNGLAEIA